MYLIEEIFLKRLLRGKFNAFEITDGIEERFERNAEKGGIENPLIPVESLIKQMVKDFEKQSLDSPLQLNIENYLPRLIEGQGQQSSMTPLPPTPMPNPGSFQTPVQENPMMASGLTPMEESYLSPSEKQIRLRSRGINNA